MLLTSSSWIVSNSTELSVDYLCYVVTMLTKEETIFTLKTFDKSGACAVINEWNEHIDSNPPSRQALYNLQDKFENMDLLQMYQDLATQEQPNQKNCLLYTSRCV